MESKQSAITILHCLRNNLEKKLQFTKAANFALLGFMIVDYVIFIVSGVNVFQVISVIIMAFWIIFNAFILWQIKQEMNNIDEFYLKAEL